MDGDTAPLRGGASSYVEWSAIIAGATLACAISFVLLTFGGAIGLSLTSPYRGEGMAPVAFAIATGLWVLWVEIASFMAGGYLAGRLRRRLGDSTEHEVHVRDQSHGLLVWASGVLIGAVLAFGGAGGAANGVKAAATVALAAQPLSNPFMVDLFRPQVGANRPVNVDERAAVALMFTHPDTINDADRAYAASAVASETGVSNDDAAQRVATAQKAALDAKAAAQKAADAARKMAILTAFFLAASLVVSAAAASVAAAHGGQHRDRTLVHPWLAMKIL